MQLNAVKLNGHAETKGWPDRLTAGHQSYTHVCKVSVTHENALIHKSEGCYKVIVL